MRKYLSFIRHEFRSCLLVCREGTSQVLEGFGKKDCAKCSEILKYVLESTDKLDHLIGKLLDTQTFNVALEKSKNDLMAVISHKIRTPLTITTEGVSSLLDGIKGDLNPGQREYLTDIKEGIDRLAQSIEEVLQTPSDKLSDQLTGNKDDLGKNKEK